MKNILLNFVYGFIGMSLILIIARCIFLLFIIKILMPIVLILLILALIYSLGDMIRDHINLIRKNKKKEKR